MNIPYFVCDNKILMRAARIATGDIVGNFVQYKDGMLEEEKTCLIAGLDYDTPWTRDTAINTMNSLVFIDSTVAKNTLQSVLGTWQNKTVIGGEYWDAIIWSVAAWQYYVVTDDKEFLTSSCQIIENTLQMKEQEEFDAQFCLFCGPAVYGDGVSAYPDFYANSIPKDANCGAIWSWPEYNEENRRKVGYGIPIKALSTNCVYYAAYMICAKMQELLNKNNSQNLKKATAIKESINKNFWNNKKGNYNYIFDNFVFSDATESLGISFAILFGIADQTKCEQIVKNTYISKNGIPCLWPNFERYKKLGDYGRHCGLIWPQTNGYFALAMAKLKKFDLFENELFSLGEKAVRDMHFGEIYHPETGKIYTGLQESRNEGIITYPITCCKQTWCASAYWSMIIYGLFGIYITNNEVIIKPHLPKGVNNMELHNINICGIKLTLKVTRGKGESFAKINKQDKGNKILTLFCE